MGWLGLTLVVIAGFVRWSEIGLSLPDVHIRANPWFVAERLGVLLALLGALASLGGRLSETPFFLRDVSRESLQVYVAHLMIIYGDWIDGSSFVLYYKHRFDLVTVAGITAAIMVLMICTAWGWQVWKRRSPATSRPAFIAAVAAGTIIFILR